MIVEFFSREAVFQLLHKHPGVRLYVVNPKINIDSRTDERRVFQCSICAEKIKSE
jgi:mRNA deadenylase 3'-5' endonuclease subunit Ccr4